MHKYCIKYNFVAPLNEVKYFSSSVLANSFTVINVKTMLFNYTDFFKRQKA